MFILRETIFHEDGNTKIVEKGFETKPRIIKLLRRSTPMTNQDLNELSKKNEVEFESNGLRRKVEIVEHKEFKD